MPSFRYIIRGRALLLLKFNINEETVSFELLSPKMGNGDKLGTLWFRTSPI